MVYRADWIITPHRVIERGAVLVEDGKIKAVGTWGEFGEESFYYEPGSILIPGLVNAHTHAAMVGLRGIAEDLPLAEWLSQHIWPAEAKLITPEFVREAVLVAAVEMLREGTTAFVDMYFFQREAAEAVEEVGLRAVLAEGVIDFPTPSAKSPREALELTRSLAEEFRGSERVFAAVGLHAPYTCSERTIREGVELARELGVPVHMHVAETQKEVEDITAKTGKPPFAYLESLGALGPWFSAAHAVWVSDEEVRTIRAQGVSIAHCPQSNAKLASGRAPVPKYLKEGIPVGLGTDGAASNNDLSVLAEAKFAALVHKLGEEDPTALPAEEALWMATEGGARVAGLGGKVGAIEPGRWADMVYLKPKEPVINPLAQVIYSRAEVSTVIVGGRRLLERGTLLSVDPARVEEAKRFLEKKIREVL